VSLQKKGPYEDADTEKITVWTVSHICLIVKYLLHFVNCYSPALIVIYYMEEVLYKAELDVYTNRCVWDYELCATADWHASFICTRTQLSVL
jgi:hypothetical protein